MRAKNFILLALLPLAYWGAVEIGQLPQIDSTAGCALQSLELPQTSDVFEEESQSETLFNAGDAAVVDTIQQTLPLALAPLGALVHARFVLHVRGPPTC